MKRLAYSILTAALFVGSGFAEEKKSLFAQADELKAASKEKMQLAGDKAQKLSDKASAMGQKAKEAMVKADDIMSNLDMSLEDIKAKVASLDKDQLLAYASKYKTMLTEHEELIAKTKNSLKELNWFKRIGTEGQELKSTMAGYTEKLSTLKDQYSVYTNQLKALGIDLSAYGL